MIYLHQHSKALRLLASMTMKTACWILLALILSASLIIPGAHTLSEVEALSALKKSLTDPKNVLSSWDASQANPCSWENISCNQDNKTIAVLLINEQLSGTLVPELGSLSALQRLVLSENDLSGTIPTELGNLKSLQVLLLSNNRLSGSIPPSLGNFQSLLILGLDYNELTGKIPSGLATIKTLKLAAFNNNTNLCWDFWPTPIYRGSYPLCQK